MPLALLLFLAAAQLGGQSAGGLAGRIENAPLKADQRAAVAAAFSRKDFPRVETILTAAISQGGQSPRVSELHALLGALEFVGGRMSPAAAAFERAESLRPLDDHDRFTFAMALVNLGDTRGSRVQLNLLNQSHPNLPLYLYWLARIDYFQRLYEDAVEKLKRVVRLDPNSVRGYDNLGLSYDMMGLNDEARDAFLKAVALNRKLASPSPWPPHNLGYLLLRLERFGEAEEYLREALKYDPKLALAHYYLGRALEKQGRNETAIEEYTSAAALDEKLTEPLYSLGRLYRRASRAAEADRALAEYKRRKALADAP